MPEQYINRSILDGELFETLYALQLSSNRRFHTTFTLVFISVPINCSDKWEKHLQSRIRDTDIAFRFSAPNPYQILLTNAYKSEAEIFVKRIFESFQEKGHHLKDVGASILEIANGQAAIEEVIHSGREAVSAVLSSGSALPYVIVDTFEQREKIIIRVSILEEDPLVTQILSNLLERAVLEDVEIDVKIFYDGFDFLESDWYQSAHTHLVIVNDVLPRKNGIDVLHALRGMPNERKFHIFMMTRRTSEEEMIYAYEHGIDEYIVKPFNPKLFEAQVKKLLGRLYS